MDIEKALNHLRDHAKDLADARENLVYLEHFRKSKKAILMAEAEGKGIKAAYKQEVYAYSHPEYLEFLQGLKVAVGEYEKLKHLQIAAQLKIEVWRSLYSVKKFEMNTYGVK